MANGDGLRMAVCADARHAWKFDKLAPGLDEEQSIAVSRPDPQPDAPWREMRNLRIVQKMHHVMNSGL